MCAVRLTLPAVGLVRERFEVGLCLGERGACAVELAAHRGEPLLPALAVARRAALGGRNSPSYATGGAGCEGATGSVGWPGGGAGAVPSSAATARPTRAASKSERSDGSRIATRSSLAEGVLRGGGPRGYVRCVRRFWVKAARDPPITIPMVFARLPLHCGVSRGADS